MLKINSIAVDQLLDIFNYIQDVQFWIKDKDFRYISVNSSFLDNYAIKDSREVIGKTDYDITQPYLADQFRADDIEVLKGKSIINRVELVSSFDHSAKWFLTSKIPFYSSDGKIIGTIGITQALLTVSNYLTPFGEIEEVIRYIHANFNKQLKNNDLASIANLSLSAFERNFRKLLRISPQKYIVKYRIQIATKQLIKSSDSISQIAYETGFSDQSHLIREFKKFIGITPHQYRLNYFNKIVDR